MPVRIRVRNFQSIVDAEIEVVGFTVVTGPNNSGKTAFIRAVQGLYSNPGGDAFVRHGAEKLVVDMTFVDDGQSVRWEKGPKVKPTYTVAGKVLHPGRGVPDEVLALGVRPIQVGPMTLWPQVAPQFVGQVFLLDLPGSSVAEAVADVDRVGRLTQALRFAESDKRSAASELRVRRQDVETVKSDLETYAGVDAVAAAVAHVEALLEEARQEEARLLEVEGLRVRLRSSTAVIARLVGVREVRVPEGSQLDDVRKVGAKVALATSLRDRLVQSRKDVTTFAGIRQVAVPPAPAEAARVGASVRDAVALRARLVAAKATRDRVAGIRSVVVPPSPEEARRTRDELREAVAIRARLMAARKAADVARRAGDALRGFSPDAVGERAGKAAQAGKVLTLVQSFRDRQATSKAEIAALRESLRAKNAQLTEVESEISKVLGDLGSCPVCGTGYTGRHAHAE